MKNDITPIYSDWEEYVNPDYIKVTLNNGKKIEIAKKRITGGKRVYELFLLAFQNDKYEITNKVVQGIVDRLESKSGLKEVTSKSTTSNEIFEGDIIKFRGETYIIFDISTQGRKFIHLSVIVESSLKDVLKGEKGRGIFYTLKLRYGVPVEVTGKTPSKNIPILKAEARNIHDHNREQKDKEYEKNRNESENKVDYVSGLGYVLILKDGTRCKVGDNVKVKFSNGTFTCELSKVAGDDQGRIGVKPPRYTKSKMIRPDMVISKV
jgi:hypothetical protein